MNRDTYYIHQVLKETKAPLLYISELTSISLPMLKQLKSWSKRYIDVKRYDRFIEWYKRYVDKNQKARDELLKNVR